MVKPLLTFLTKSGEHFDLNDYKFVESLELTEKYARIVAGENISNRRLLVFNMLDIFELNFECGQFKFTRFLPETERNREMTETDIFMYSSIHYLEKNVASARSFRVFVEPKSIPTLDIKFSLYYSLLESVELNTVTRELTGKVEPEFLEGYAVYKQV